MNEELNIAVEELRKRNITKRWFIPIKIDECDIPKIKINGTETLRSFQWLNLYEDWDTGVKMINEAVSKP